LHEDRIINTLLQMKNSGLSEGTLLKFNGSPKPQNKTFDVVF
jgi:hypothetical protein